jgi:hypothetical protein
MKNSNSIRKGTQFFAGALLALSLFGCVLSRDVNSRTSDHRVNAIEQTQTPPSGVDWGYKPPYKPGTH